MKDIYHNNSKDSLDLFSTFLDTNQSGFTKNRQFNKKQKIREFVRGKMGGVL